MSILRDSERVRTITGVMFRTKASQLRYWIEKAPEVDTVLTIRIRVANEHKLMRYKEQTVRSVVRAGDRAWHLVAHKPIQVMPGDVYQAEVIGEHPTSEGRL